MVNNQISNKASSPSQPAAYLPVKQLWKGKSEPIQKLVGNGIHSVLFWGANVVAEAPGRGLVVSSPAQSRDRNHPDGLYIVSTSSGKVAPLLQLNAAKHEQIDIAASCAKWLVYELGTNSGTQNTWSLFAYNWATRQTRKIYSVPVGVSGSNDASGLYVEGDKCIWSNYVQDRKSIAVSEIHQYDLATHHDEILVRTTTHQSLFQTSMGKSRRVNEQNGIIYWASAAGGKVMYSLFDGSNPMDTSPPGDIYEIDLSAGRVSHVLHIYHSANPMCSYGNELVMETDYAQAPNGPNNPAPYPVYLYKKGDKHVSQLSPFSNAYFPTQNARFVAWTGPAVGEPQMYDLQTSTYYTLPGINASIVGSYITWLVPTKGSLSWAKLPD